MKTSEKTPDNTLAAPDKVSTVPQKSQQESNAPQLQSPQMTMDLEDHAAHVTRPRPQPPSRPQVPPGYQPTDTMANESILVPTNIGLTGYVSGHVDAVEEELPDEFFDNDTSSEAELRQAAVAAWADSPGTATDVVNQSSDDFGDDVDDIRDDEEDEEDDDDIEEDEDNFSDDTGDTDELQEARTKDYHYSRAAHHGPYLKSRRQTEQLRKSHGRSAALRKRPLKLRTISGTGPRTDSIVNPGVTYSPVQDATTESISSEQVFTQTCEEVTDVLHQGLLQHGIDIVKNLIEYNIEWRRKKEQPQGCLYTPNQLRVLENEFFGLWAKMLVERRASTHTVAIVMFLKDFIQLGCLIVEQENTLSELYAQIMNAIFEQGELEIYKRNPKRPSRLAHIERLTRFEDYASEYGPEDDEVPQLQVEFQRLFSGLGGLEICMKAIEYHLNNSEQPEVRLLNLQLMLGLISRIPVSGDSEHSQISKLSDLSRRLVAAVLAVFPDHADSFRFVNKTTVLDIISQVGCFLLENYRLQGLHSNAVVEQDTGYGEYGIQDQMSLSNLGEVKFADFRLEMAVRLMKTSRLDLRLAGLIELKEVLVRIQRLQQGRSRLHRRSEADMDVQMEMDRKPIEHLCSKLQSMRIMGCIFGSNIHLEIVQRSTDVLVFLVQARVLTIDDIDLIWASVGGNQHPSIVHGVYQVLGELCSKLPQEFLRNLFIKLQAVALDSWDLQLVDLARSQFLAMVQRAKYNPEEGPISLIPYETLLNVLRNSTPPFDTHEDPSFSATTPSNRNVIAAIAQLLKEGLGVGPLPQDRMKLVGRCMQDLKSNHPGAIWSLQVVQHIFESHFINNESGSLQFYKQACSSLPELYISNLKAYTVALKATPPAVSPTASSFAQLSTHHLSQEYWRGLQLKIRLDFLKTIARIFPVYWNSPDLAETLWSCLIVDPISIQEQDETFACLEGIAEPQFVEYIYEILLPGLEVAAVTQKAWQCIKQYFLLLNWQKRNLVVATDPLVDGSQAIVVLAPLYGMDLIWEIALQARLPAVGANAIDLLSSLCKAHSGQEESGALEEIYEFREGLVETCIEHLVRSSDQLGGEDTMDMPDVSLVFERCIGILKAFLLACNAERSDGATRLEIHGTLDEDAMLTIRVSSNLPQFQVSIHPSATLASLRRMIATKLGCSEPEDVRLFSLGKDFATAWDSRTLEELHIDNCQSILASKRPQSAISLRPTPTMKRVPTDLLLQPSFFERVRRIFLLEERYASQAWEVVVRLPTSSVLLHSLESLQEDVDWTTVLDARSPFLLLYSLQIVNCLIKRDQCFEDPEKQIWIKRFLRLGGQRHLTALLMSESGLGAANTSPIARKALALMLKVLVRLTSSAEIESGMATDSNGPTVPEFLNKLVQEILTSASRTGGHDTNDQSIVLNAAGLISYLCAGPQGWHHFQAGSDIRSLIFVSMIQSESMQIRQTVLEMGKKFCSQFKNPVSADVSPIMFFLDILQSFLPVSKEYESNCSELFEFFEIIAREAVNYCSEDRFKALYTRLMETIIGHSSSEDMSMQKDDTILIGMLRVASAMINTDARLKQLYTNFRIIDYIMDDCLFPQGSHFSDTVDATTLQVAKCQSEGSRSAAFEFLEESAKGEPETLRHIIMKTRNQFARESEIEDQWGYDPQMIKKAGCGFVGLQNLGATCYVNSIIQQFFMNKEFRHGILDAPVSEDDPGRHDTLLYQLQVLFGHLQQSIKRAYNAHGFCYAYKDWDGNPMNVAVQMDVDEFFNILFDRLENSVKSTPQELLFKQQYGGKLVQQIKSKDCEHISEREDSFFSIQCEVKNKKTLEESLQLYVQGEILDGDNKYKCSSCDKHVDAIKRACIKELPQNLILHLKRFDYDMDTMRRIKINDRFEFPTRLDMEPYTLDYLTRKEQAQEGAGGSPVAYSTGGQENAGAFQYNLVGVLVHTGTADSGHYYSYIKDRSSDIPSGSSLGSTYGERTRWLFFNDSKVEEFDANEIPAKAFGGPEYIPQESSPYLKSPPRSTTKPYSAYMLFYERVDHRTQEPHEGMSGNVPVDIEGVVAKENAALLKDLVVFDRQYYRFIWELFNLYRTFPQQIDNDDEGAAMAEPLDYLSMQYGLDFFFSVLIHARDVDQELQQWTRFLSSLLAQYPKGCANFLRNLADNQTLLSNILLLCPITQVREAVVDLIYDAFHDLRECDKVEYGLTVSLGSGALIDTTVDSVEDDNLICIHGSPVHLFIQTLLRMLSEARANWRNFDEYFKLMYNITQLGRAERVLMAQEGYLTDLAEFYTFDERTDSKKKKMGDKFTKPSFHYLLLTIQEVLTTCDIRRSCEALQRRTQVQDSAHGPVGNNAYRKSSSSSSSTSSVLSSSNSDEVAVEDDMHIPSVSPELGRSVIISTADFNALFASTGPSLASERSLIFFTKMIADRTDSAIIARMVTHLSSHEVTGQRLLASLSSYLQYASEDQFTIIMQVFKELVQVVDENLEARVEFILVQLLKVLERSPQPSIAYDCLEFFRTISDYGQCGRSAQGWLLRNNRMWLQELLLMQTEPDTRLRARSFFMELLSSERAFNGWSDDQAAVASAQHFGRLLELLKVIPDILS
ncbi:hypothetical protein BC939DRAFT_460245, partial [Gamsiella multidivaricata]|uniref:uncharacterized protein n=1 Tax=Gamsiella multidivaricata TaxID=101098 RepID=UPI00221F04D5